jgi:hypothetical protein
MTVILLIISGAGLALTAAVLAIVVVGIRQEPAELSSRAPSLGTALVRRLLGVYVHRPDPRPDAGEHEACLSSAAPSWPEGRSQ